MSFPEPPGRTDENNRFSRVASLDRRKVRPPGESSGFTSFSFDGIEADRVATAAEATRARENRALARIARRREEKVVFVCREASYTVAASIDYAAVRLFRM